MNIIQKTKRGFEKKHVNDIKIFLKKKIKNAKKRLEADIKIFLKRKKNKKKCQYYRDQVYRIL